MEDGKHAFASDLLLKFILNLSLFNVKKCFRYVFKSLFILFHENETFATVLGVDFQLFRD